MPIPAPNRDRQASGSRFTSGLWRIPALCLAVCLLLPFAALAAENAGASTPAVPVAATAATAATATPAATAPVAAEEVQGAWDALVHDSLKALADIETQAAELQSRLPALAEPVTRLLPSLTTEFKQLSALAQLSQNMPAELSVVAERARRLNEQIRALVAPLESSMSSLANRLNELAAMDVDIPEAADEAMQDFHQQLAGTQKRLKSLQTRMTAVLAPVNKLSEDITAFQSRIEKNMPELWRAYYLAPTGKVFDPATWEMDFQRLGSILNIFALRTGTELPRSGADQLFTLLRILAAAVPLLLLLYASRRAAARVTSPAARAGWLRVTESGALWFVAGLALYYAAVGGTDVYQMLASLGALTLCWGQMRMAWDLYVFGQPDKPKLSPLWPMFPPLLAGMILLYFNSFPLLLTLGWLATLAVSLWRAHARKPFDDKLTKALLPGFTGVLWLSLILSFIGFTRLSILICAAYTALGVCIQQDVAVLRLGNSMEQALPENGARTLAMRLLLALAVPLALLVVTLTPGLWILAYPGGVYLLRHAANLGFSVGAFSFNIMQVVSIFIAFYLTRSLIVVGKTFITGLRKGSAASSPLVGPFQTAYTYALWALFGLYVLGALGFQLTSLAIVAGGLSVGVGFGLQNIVQNFISGLMVIFGQIIREGDVVEVTGVTGVVRRVNIRSTQVETFDNAVVFIPNSQFLSNAFTNWTHNGLSVRKEIAVGVAYGSDLALCMRLLTQAASEHPKTLAYPAPTVFFTDFGASSLNLLLRYWIGDYGQGMIITTEIRLRVNELFAQNGISVPFPQMDVHMNPEGDEAEVPSAANAAAAANAAETAKAVSPA